MRQAVRSADGKLAINSAGRSKLKSVRSTVSTTQTKGEGKQSQPYKNMAIPRKMGHSQAPKEAILAFFSADFGKQARIYGLAARAQPPFPAPIPYSALLLQQACGQRALAQDLRPKP